MIHFYAAIHITFSQLAMFFKDARAKRSTVRSFLLFVLPHEARDLTKTKAKNTLSRTDIRRGFADLHHPVSDVFDFPFHAIDHDGER